MFAGAPPVEPPRAVNLACFPSTSLGRPAPRQTLAHQREPVAFGVLEQRPAAERHVDGLLHEASIAATAHRILRRYRRCRRPACWAARGRTGSARGARSPIPKRRHRAAEAGANAPLRRLRPVRPRSRSCRPRTAGPLVVLHVDAQLVYCGGYEQRLLRVLDMILAFLPISTSRSLRHHALDEVEVVNGMPPQLWMLYPRPAPRGRLHADECRAQVADTCVPSARVGDGSVRTDVG